MHDQRARAINHAELAKRTSYKLSLTNLLGGSFGLADAARHAITDVSRPSCPVASDAALSH